MKKRPSSTDADADRAHADDAGDARPSSTDADAAHTGNEGKYTYDKLPMQAVWSRQGEQFETFYIASRSGRIGFVAALLWYRPCCHAASLLHSAAAPLPCCHSMPSHMLPLCCRCSIAIAVTMPPPGRTLMMLPAIIPSPHHALRYEAVGHQDGFLSPLEFKSAWDAARRLALTMPSPCTHHASPCSHHALTMRPPCPHHAPPRSHRVLTMLSRHAASMLSPCSHQALTMLSPCPHHALTMLSPCSHHALTMLSPCLHHALTMLSPCSHHAPTMSSPCSQYVLRLHVSTRPFPSFLIFASPFPTHLRPPGRSHPSSLRLHVSHAPSTPRPFPPFPTFASPFVSHAFSSGFHNFLLTMWYNG